MTGVLPSQTLRQMIANGQIVTDSPLAAGQIQPASLDLRLGSVAYRMRASFLPGQGARIRDRLPEFEMHRFSLTDGAVLEKGCVYLIPLV